jgi:indolepyruvate ferredoxin oxidoreductase beta subunit
MEAVRYADYLKPNGVAVINDYEIVSSTIATGAAEYPTGCLEAMQENFECYTLNAAKIAEELGSAKCMNIVLFGAMTAALKMDDIDWEAIIAETVPAKFKALNLKAYRAGRAAAMGE